VRVIAGSRRGLRLAAPAGDRVRPTLDRVRESLFNMVASQVEGVRFLDLFAGSGANGIEALSRGARESVFVDSHRDSLECVRRNLATARLDGQAVVMNLALPEGLRRIPGRFGLIYADPPFEFDGYEALLTAVSEGGMLETGGQVIVEHGFKTDLPENLGSLTRSRERRYGKAVLSFYA